LAELVKPSKTVLVQWLFEVYRISKTIQLTRVEKEKTTSELIKVSFGRVEWLLL